MLNLMMETWWGNFVATSSVFFLLVICSDSFLMVAAGQAKQLLLFFSFPFLSFFGGLVHFKPNGSFFSRAKGQFNS